MKLANQNWKSFNCSRGFLPGVSLAGSKIQAESRRFHLYCKFCERFVTTKWLKNPTRKQILSLLSQMKTNYRGSKRNPGGKVNVSLLSLSETRSISSCIYAGQTACQLISIIFNASKWPFLAVYKFCNFILRRTLDQKLF